MKKFIVPVVPHTPHPHRGEGCLFERSRRVIPPDNAPVHGNRRAFEKQMAATRYDPSLEFQDDTAGRARLLPLVLAAIWACTALSVEVSSPRIDGQLWRVGVVDLLVNIGLYVPLGIALRRRGALSAMAFAAALSLVVEVIQLFYPDRYTAGSDVIANVGGAFLGWFVSKRFDRRSAWGFDPLPLTTRLSVFAVCLYVTTAVFLSLPGLRSDFSNWDPDCRLVAGDELTRNRPWSGEIDAVAVFDECFRSGEIERLSTVDSDSALDARIASAPPLFFARPLHQIDSIRGVPLMEASEHQRFFDALVASGKLTLVVWFRTRSEGQTGPARIVGFSKSPWAQNFSLGQEEREIVFRLRTTTTAPGGFYPQIKTRAILEEGRPTFVAATYDGRNARVYVDGRSEARLNLCARAKRAAFLTDSGLPASATFLGGLMGVAWVVAARKRRSNVRLWGAVGGLIGGAVFALSGGTSALPEFTPWVPVLAAGGGLVVGCAVAEGPPWARDFAAQ